MYAFNIGDIVVINDHRRLLWEGEVTQVNPSGSLNIRWVATEKMHGTAYQPGTVLFSDGWKNLYALSVIATKETMGKSLVERKVLYLRNKWRDKMKKKGKSYAHI